VRAANTDNESVNMICLADAIALRTRCRYGLSINRTISTVGHYEYCFSSCCYDDAYIVLPSTVRSQTSRSCYRGMAALASNQLDNELTNVTMLSLSTSNSRSLIISILGTFKRTSPYHSTARNLSAFH